METKVVEQEERQRPAATPNGGQAARWMIVAAAALACLGAGALYAWRSGSNLEDLQALGYPGIFLITFIAGAGTLFPMPSQAAVIAAGSVWNPLLVGLAAGLGNATGELVTYAVGRAGEAILRSHRAPRLWRRLQSLVARYGFVTILVVALVPNFIFDFIGLLAGSLGYPARRFWLACLIGNSVKYAVYAYFGDAARAWLFPI